MELSGCQRQKNGQLICPHCRAGEDEISLGLFWDLSEKAWRCIACGHRSYERRPKTQAQLLEDLVWDRVLESLEPIEPKEEVEEDLEPLNAVGGKKDKHFMGLA